MRNYQIVIRKLPFLQVCEQVKLKGKTDINTYYAMIDVTNDFYSLPFNHLRTKTISAQELFDILEKWKDDLDKIDYLTEKRIMKESLLSLRICFKREYIKFIRFIRKIFYVK